MRLLKTLVILLLVYVAIVVAFESLIGYFQPAGAGTLVITTTDEQGRSHDRVVSSLESHGELYVAANHWPRAWFEQALANPQVQVTIDGERRAYSAIPVVAAGAEHERLMTEHAHGFVFRFLTGFPPRYFLRLEPR